MSVVALLCLGCVWSWHLAVAASYNAAMSLNKSGSPRKETEAEKQSRLLANRAARSTIRRNRVAYAAIILAVVRVLFPGPWNLAATWVSSLF